MKLKHGVTVMTTAMALGVAGAAFAQGQPPEIEPAPIPESSAPGPQTTTDPTPTPETQVPAAPEAAAPEPAIPETTPLGTPLYTPDTTPAEPTRWMPASKFGMAIMAGGGLTDFTQGNTRSTTNTGGSWDARFAVGTRSWVGAEASYIGGANGIDGLGLAGNSTLVRNGVEGVLRINAPLYAKDTLLEPYVFGGAGYNGYRVTNVNSFTASVTRESDSTVSVPLGVGFAVGYKGFVGDLRYTIRPTYQQDILALQGSTALTNWDAGAMLGYEF